MASVPSIKAFMRAELKEETIVTIPGIKTFSDENGKPIDMKIRVITTGDLAKIRKACHVRRIAKDAKGKPIFQNGTIQYDDQYDGNAMNDQMIAQSLVFPDLHDKELLDFYGCADAVELVHKLFAKLDDYTYITEKIQEVSGISSDGDEVIEEAKN